MKTLPTLILLALICFLHHSSAGPFYPGLGLEECCPSFNRRLIPKARVKHVARTSNRCKTPGIVVTDVCDKMSCIDPNWKWAKKLLAEFETATANSLISEERCCPGFNRRLIPKKKVKHVAMTASHCETPAIVVTDVNGSKSCIDPDWRWAKNLLAEFETATANSTSPSASFNMVKCERPRKQ